MIFVYPALVSKNIDWKVLPAILKVIEKFFLVQIGQSFSSGSLRIKTEWDGKKNRYTELMLENTKITVKDEILFNFLNEAVSTTQMIKDYYNSDVLIYKKQNQIDSQRKKIIDNNNSIQKNSGQMQKSLIATENADLDRSNAILKNEITALEQERKEMVGKIKERGEIQKLDLDVDKKKVEREKLKISKEQDARNDAKDKREREKYEKEKADLEKEKYKRHAGKFDLVKSKGVSLDPSMANIEVSVHYIGGPATSDVGHSGLIKNQNITIGCQMAPTIIKNFDAFQYVLLNDYFSTKSEMMFKSRYRDFLRKSDKIIDKIYQYVTGDVKSKKLDPDVKEDVLYAPRGFIDASSFRRKSGTPKFYNYAAAIVVFNKSDITEAEDENIFENQAQLKKMFRAGWNSFCIVDNTQEEVTFISMLDGGFIHRLTFSYIFNALDAKDVFENLDDLKRSASPFQRNIGNFRNLGKYIAKESTLVKSILKFMNG